MLRLTLPKPTASAKSPSRHSVPRQPAKPSTAPRPSAKPADRPAHVDLGPLFTLSADALVVQDVASGRIAQFNPAAELLFGYAAVDVVGKPIGVLLPPAVARLHQERLAHFTRTGEIDVLTGRDSLQIPAMQKGGEEIRVELSTALIDSDGRFVLLTFRDGRSTKDAELQALELARAQSALAEAEAKLAARERLLLEAPRNVERALLGLRRAAARLNTPSVRSDRDRIVLLTRLVDARAEDARRIMRDVADSAALETDAFELRTERINLVPLISRLVAGARRRTGAHRVSLAAPQGLTVTADAARLQDMFERIIDAAIRRNPRGCWVDVDVRRPLAGIARIEVRDYGRRLSPRERQALPGSSDPSLAWSLIEAIVQRHGGTLAVEVAPEGGCRVAVTLSTNGGRVTA